MANKEVAELTAAATLDGTELVHVVQSGNSRRTTTGGVAATILIDEDNFASDSATKAPSQQSTKAYIDTAIPAKLNASGTAPVYACRAWVNFNGTGTIAVRASGNVTSITDNGVGNYTVNLATAMPDANYVLLGTAGNNNNAAADPLTVRAGALASKLTTAFAFSVNANVSGSNLLFDAADVNIAVFR